MARGREREGREDDGFDEEEEEEEDEVGRCLFCSVLFPTVPQSCLV